MISIVIAGDHASARKGVRRLLEAESDLRICAEAHDGHELLTQVDARQPDVVVMDVELPKLNGLETLERLRATHPSTPVVLLSPHGARSLIQSALTSGADAFVLDDGVAKELVAAVRAVLEGGSYFSPLVAREIARLGRRALGTAAKPDARLSGREREVLQLIAEGLSTKEIAAKLEISGKTVEAHRTSLMRKLGVHKATGLVRFALRHGLIEP